MIISTPQMAHRHNLHNLNMEIYLDRTQLERVPVAKILGMHFNNHLKWNDHVTMAIKTCTSTLSVLRKIKNFADFKLRKQLAETLVLTKLDYNMSVYDPLPAYLMKRLQRTQNAAASFVF